MKLTSHLLARIFGLTACVIPVTAFSVAKLVPTVSEDASDFTSLEYVEEDYDPYIGWTEEEIRHHEDSILALLYPQPTLVPADNSLPDTETVQPYSTAVMAAASASVPTSVTIDKSKTVGEIKINSGTSQFGSKTYEVPLQLYPGINGFQPQLSIRYDSQQGNSILGTGWYLSGVACIERSSKNIYYDSKSEGVVMDNTDSFLLDGIRLIKTGVADGYISYQSEQGNIRAKGYVTDNVMKYFEVFYPDGNKGIFGYTYGDANRLSYPLSVLTNPDGQTISYTHTYENFHYTLKKITYNGVTIDFTYTDSRPDPLVDYKGNLRVYEPRLLKSISCKLGSTVLGTYTMSYNSLYGKSVMSKIDYASAGKSVNPLIFYYGDDSIASSYSSFASQLNGHYNSDTPNSIKYVQGKFDYFGGNEGVAAFPNNQPYWHRKGGKNNNYSNLHSADETIFVYTSLGSSYVSGQSTIKSEEGFIDILCADLEGNQEDYLIKVNNRVVNGKDEITFKAYHNVPSAGGLSLIYTRKFSFSTATTDKNGNSSVQPKFYHVGDFDGDGKMEILAMSSNSPLGDTSKPSMCYIFDIIGNRILCQNQMLSYKVVFAGSAQTDAEYCANNTDKLFAIDFDGDGKTDICHIDNNAVYVYTFDKSGTSLVPRKIVTYCDLNNQMLANRDLLAGDFNGDGKTDLLVSPETATGAGLDEKTWHMYCSKAKTAFDHTSFSCRRRLGAYDTGFLTQDVNNDGRTDLIAYDSKNFYTYLSTGESLTASVTDIVLPETHTTIIPTSLIAHSSFTKVLGLKDGKLTKYSFSRDESKELMMAGMVNSLGVVEKNHYLTLDATAIPYGSYTYATDAVFPYVNIKEPISVVSATQTYLDGNHVNTSRYDYFNAVIHRQGLGFCGFGKIICNDNKGLVYERTYAPYKYCMPVKESTKTHERTYTVQNTVSTNKVRSSLLTKLYEKDLLTGISKNVDYSYDTYGYPVKETTTFSDGLSSVTDKSYCHNATVQDGYNLGFMITQKTTTSDGVGSSYETTSIPTYQIAKRRATAVVYYKDGYKISQTALTYDDKGNITKKSVKPYSSTIARDTVFSYDSYGRIVKTTDPLGLTKENTYNAYGRLSGVKDERGNTTSYTYDAIGNLTKVTNPDNTVKTITHSWNSGTDGLYTVTTSETGKPTVASVYDALNRTVLKKEMRFNGSYRNTAYKYDLYGNMTGESLPFSGNTPVEWNTFTFDRYNRQTEATYASGKTISYTYSGTSVTTTEENVSTTRTKDSMGRLVSVADPAGTVTISLRPDGQISSITAPGNVTTSISYDSYGRRTEISDPSAGTLSYTYDAAGNISKETDANGISTTYQYDNYGRMTKKVLDDFTSTYTYSDTNDLIKVSSTNGSSREMTYDSFGRLSVSKETAAAKWLQKTYTYSNGNISTIAYKSNSGDLVTESYTYTNGHFSEGKANGTSVYKLISDNIFGQPTEVVTGGITHKYTYTDYNLPTSIITKKESKVYQNFSYNFDPDTYNLLSRKDVIRDIEEEFEYDALNRLISCGDATVSYDSKGNILSRSDAGTFIYGNSQKPYAVSGMTPISNSVPVRVQNISYTSFRRPETIKEGGYEASFMYNDEYERVRMLLKYNSNTTMTRYYLGDSYEIDVEPSASTERLYLFGDAYKAPAVYIKGGSNSGINYIARDYMGSITHVISAGGTVLQELSYDAWGRLRNPVTQKVYTANQEPALLLGRGYCGHEHLTQFGLINMNARLYDPAVGRFLSPDPYIQNMEMTQNFNRYSYALNNPLKYTDPNGEFVFMALNAIVEFFINIGKDIKNHTFNVGAYEWKHTRFSWKIFASLFKGDFTTVLGKLINPMSWFGYLQGQVYNTAREVSNVTSYNGFVAIAGPLNNIKNVGCFSIGPDGYTASPDPDNTKFIKAYYDYFHSFPKPTITGILDF